MPRERDKHEGSWFSAIRKLAETGLWEIGRQSLMVPPQLLRRDS